MERYSNDAIRFESSKVMKANESETCVISNSDKLGPITLKNSFLMYDRIVTYEYSGVIAFKDCHIGIFI